MKRFCKYLAFFALAIFASCETKEVAPVQEKSAMFDLSDVTVTNITMPGQRGKRSSFLSFKNRTAYERVLDNMPENRFEQWEKQLAGYTSARAIGGLTGVEDDKLAAILSPEGMIQINGYLFKIDVANQKTYVVSENASAEAVNALMSADASHEEVMLFSTNDEVLDLLENGSTGTLENGKTALFGCGESGASQGKQGGTDALANLTQYQHEGYTYRVDSKIVYQAASIYFSLLTEAKHQKKTASGFWDKAATDMDVYYKFTYKPKCDYWVPLNTKYVLIDWLSGGNLSSAITDKLNYRHYSKSKALSAYYLEAECYYRQLNDWNWRTVQYLEQYNRHIEHDMP